MEMNKNRNCYEVRSYFEHYYIDGEADTPESEIQSFDLNSYKKAVIAYKEAVLYSINCNDHVNGVVSLVAIMNGTETVLANVVDRIGEGVTFLGLKGVDSELIPECLHHVDDLYRD